MEYLISNKRYSFSYKEVKAKYEEICELTDEEFMDRLPEITHLACFISYLKELPTEVVLSDKGIIHELVHLIHIPDEPLVSLKEIRELFKLVLSLS
jgi:hypothetical protein